jgi:signal transduction histidine kinase
MISDRHDRLAAPSAGRWTMQLPDGIPAVRAARLAAARWLGHADESLVRDARSVVTELVSNAVRYGEPPITLTVILDGDRCRVEVVHSGARRWARRWPHGGGWGVQIIGGIGERWGVDGTGSRAWCELRVTR